MQALKLFNEKEIAKVSLAKVFKTSFFLSGYNFKFPLVLEEEYFLSKQVQVLQSIIFITIEQSNQF